MDKSPKAPIVVNRWQKLRQFTDARIALGRAGTSLPTRPHLEFQFAHARARDAVHHQLEIEPLRAALTQSGHELIVLHSAAGDRQIYLQRPDQGRRLDIASRRILEERAQGHRDTYDVVFVIADGLSAFAIQENAIPLLDRVLPRLASERWRVGPLIIVQQGRVAVGDEVAEALGAEMVAIMIGERPGLSSPDSMGIYLTYQPRVGTTDACRNCISNVRRAGMSYELAAHKLVYLMTEARRRRLTGVSLKDEAQTPQRLTAPGANFLTETD